MTELRMVRKYVENKYYDNIQWDIFDLFSCLKNVTVSLPSHANVNNPVE